MSIYVENGFPTREAYLESLAKKLCLSKLVVFGLAASLGEIEDFDALPTMLVEYKVFSKKGLRI